MLTRTTLTAQDIMATRVITLSPDMNIYDAMELLLKHSISGAPVCDDQGHLVGVLSEFDCIRLVGESGFHDDFGESEGPVSAYMSTSTHTIAPDTDIAMIAATFIQKRIRRLPVCDGHRLVGQVSRRDVLKGLVRLRKEREAPRFPDYRRPA